MYGCVKFKKRGEKPNNFRIVDFLCNVITFFHRFGNVCIRDEIPEGMCNLDVNPGIVLINWHFRGLSTGNEGTLTFFQGPQKRPWK